MDERPLKPQETIYEIPADTTHKDITRAVLGGLEESPIVVIEGPSRAGKSTYLADSLIPSIRDQLNTQVTLVNGLENMEDEVVRAIIESSGVLVLDEAFRLAKSEAFMVSLRQRKNRGGSSILVTTTDAGHPDDLSMIASMSEYDPISFPLEMSMDDARSMIEREGQDLSEPQRKQLLDLTRNPAIMGRILRLCNKANIQEENSIEAVIKEAIVSGTLYFEPSLSDIRNRMCNHLGLPQRSKGLRHID